MADVREVIIGYNSAVTESRELAEFYLSRLGAGPSRMVELECSTNPIVDSYEEFRDSVETPLKNRSSTGVSAYVLGFRVPVAFRYNGGLVSACARMSNPFELQTGVKNPQFNASGNIRISRAREAGFIPCSSIDMPSINSAKKLVSSATSYAAGVTVDGNLLLDPHPPNNVTSGYFSAALNEFERTIGRELFPNFRKSEIQPPPYDSSFPYAVGDSFFFGWGLTNANESYFLSQQEKRAVFFNADEESLSQVRPSSSGFSPCVSAISGGYVFSIGSVGKPASFDTVTDSTYFPEQADSAPHPSPLFISITSGESAAEALVLSIPNLDSQYGSIGCPFARFSIRKSIQAEKLPPIQIIKETQYRISNAIAKIHSGARLIDEMQSRVFRWSDQMLAINLGKDITNFAKDNGVRARKNTVANAITSYSSFISHVGYGQIFSNQPSFVETIEAAGQKISGSFIDYSQSGPTLIKEIASSTFEKPGCWAVEFTLQNMNDRLGFVHFQIEIYNQVGEKVDEIKSYLNPSLFSYDSFGGIMTQMSSDGLFSGRVGTKIRATSRESGSSLKRSELATARIRQIIDRHTFSAWREFEVVATS